MVGAHSRWPITASEIEPQFSEQIFGPFKRLHGREQYPGSGLGLAICQRIVEQYDGRIWLDKSAPGEGSTFCFTVLVAPEGGHVSACPIDSTSDGNCAEVGNQPASLKG